MSVPLVFVQRKNTPMPEAAGLDAIGGVAPASYATMLDAAPIGLLQWAVAAMLTGVMVLDGLDLQLAAFSAPLLMADWGLSKPGFAPLLAAATIGMAVGTVIGSWAGDRYGRKPSIVMTVAFFGAMTVVCAGASGPTGFLACRFLSGLGFGAAFPVAITLMSEWIPPRAKGKAVSIMTVGIPLGGMLGALLASWILPHFGWRVMFIATGVLCMLFALVLLLQLLESPGFLILRDRQPEVRALLADALQRRLDDVPDSFSIEPRPKARRGLFARANLRVNLGLWIAVLANSCATYAIGGWVTTILTGLGLPLATALRGPLTFSLPAIVGALVIGWLLARFGSRGPLLTLCLTVVASAGIMSAAAFALPVGSDLLTVLFVGLGVVGFCAGALQAAFYVLAANAYPTPFRSRGIGVAAVMGRIGTILSSFIGSAALSLGHEEGFFGVIAGLAALAVIGTLIVDRHVPQPTIRAAARQQPEAA